MDTSYAAQYRDLYQRHWWWRARERFILSTIRQHQPRRGGAVLDVGCGDGLFFSRLAEFGRVEGVEADASLVTAQSERNGPIHIGPFDRDFRPDKRYSLILMLDILEHLDDPAAALRYAVELLEPTGVLLVTVPAFRMLWTTHDDLNCHYTRYTQASFGQLADTAGMRVDACQYFFHWLFPLKLMVRLTESLLHPSPAPPRVPSSWMNRCFYSVSRLEQAVLRHAALPFGSSLLAVGGRCADTSNDGRTS